MRKAKTVAKAVKAAKTPKAPVIALPDMSGGLETTVATVVGSRVVFVTLAHDRDCQNPLDDCDGMGSIQSLNRRHVNHISAEEFANVMAENKDAVALSYFEHGQCLWGVQGTMGGIPDFQWDGVGVAGVWTPDASLNESAVGMTPKRRAKMMREWAAQACATYTSWCNGDVYGFIIEIYAARLDDDGETCTDRRVYKALGNPVYDDSCWGHIGGDWAREATKEAVAGIPLEFLNVAKES